MHFKLSVAMWLRIRSILGKFFSHCCPHTLELQNVPKMFQGSRSYVYLMNVHKMAVIIFISLKPDTLKILLLYFNTMCCLYINLLHWKYVFMNLQWNYSSADKVILLFLCLFIYLYTIIVHHFHYQCRSMYRIQCGLV